MAVGDLVRVPEDGFFPADMLVINSSEPEGSLYVETKNLDGETNLKLKTVAKDLINHFKDEESYTRIAGVLNVEEPNNRIYKFDGNYDVTALDSNLGHVDENGCSMVSLSNENVVLRGMSLRNTEHVTGIVVYTGHDSKIQMNSAGAIYKTSNIMRITNR